MTLTIELPPELDERLREESAREGMPAGEYARKILEERLLAGEGKPFGASATSDEHLSAFNDWVNSHAGNAAPLLSDEAVSRAEIYREREDRQL